MCLPNTTEHAHVRFVLISKPWRKIEVDVLHTKKQFRSDVVFKTPAVPMRLLSERNKTIINLYLYPSMIPRVMQSRSLSRANIYTYVHVAPFASKLDLRTI